MDKKIKMGPWADKKFDKCDLKSIPWRLAEFCYNRELYRLYASSCTILQETINGFLCPLIVSLESEIHQLNSEGHDEIE